VRVSDATVVLEKTKLIDMGAHFKAAIGRRGDAGDYLEWLCLSGADNKRGWVLWLTSGEIDAGAVGGFQWQRIPSGAQVDKRCRKLPDSVVELPHALRLGMSHGDLLRILGQPTRRQGERLLYVHEEEQVIRNEPYSETNTLVVRFRKGVVWAIGVSKSTVS